MIELVVGLDVGGTKVSLIAETRSRETVIESMLPSRGWDAEPASSGAGWVEQLLRESLPDRSHVAALGIGAQGLDTDEIAREFEGALAQRGLPARAVNDAALLVPAAGLELGIGVIAGTGSIAVGVDDAGNTLFAGGWGWVLGDEAGAAGIVREATKAALLGHDNGEVDDGLLAALLTGFGVSRAERLARAVNDEPTMENWGSRAPYVFVAADEGSALALTVILRASSELARLVTQLKRRNAVGSDIVVAGSVILNQPRMFDGFRGAVSVSHPDLAVRRLEASPVVGALRLARELASA
jgi:N-acetylglucosamine kinase-like BadF-type ATPase